MPTRPPPLPPIAAGASALHQIIPRNDTRAVWAVGDVHGCFALLERALERVGFRHGEDRLVGVGDLIDRGPESVHALEWATSGTMHTVKGNHEWMMQACLDPHPNPAVAQWHRKLWHDNGGAWWDKAHAGGADPARWLAWLKTLPITLTVETAAGPVGIVHAQPGAPTWAKTIAQIARSEEAIDRALWSRIRYEGPNENWGETSRDWAGGCSDVRCIVTGHQIVKTPEIGTPIMSIDTGAWRHDAPYGQITLARLDLDPVEIVSTWR